MSGPETDRTKHLDVRGVAHHSCCYCGSVKECPACIPGPCDEPPPAKHLWQFHPAKAVA